jgi:putative ABC transport system permease protein
MRDEYGDVLEAALEDDLREARAIGASPLLIWISAAGDVVRRAPYEHWRRRGRRTQRGHRMWFILSDLRYAVRTFARQPGATAMLLTTLALAVAANTAVFTLLDGLFLRALPFANSDRLVYLNEKAPRWNLEFTGINYPDFATWRDRARAFEAMGVWADQSVNLASEGGAPERVDAAQVSYDLPAALGLRPVIGRFFTREEDRPKGPKVVAIGYDLWQRRFGGSRDVIGRTLRLNSDAYTIVGVLPPAAEFPNRAKLWLTLGEDPKAPYTSYYLDGIARLKPDVPLAQAEKDLDNAHAPIWATRDSLHVVSPRVMPLRDRFVASYRTISSALGAGVALVLLIACANVAGAMLARSVFRRREIGVRIALGASAGRVTRQLLTESLALAAIAGAVGIPLGLWALHAVLALNPLFGPRWTVFTAGPHTILFSLGVVTATAVLFGLAPALELRRQSAQGALASSTLRVSTSARDRRLLGGLVVVEIALATVLLAGGGLLMRAYDALRHIDPKFRPAGVALFRVTLPEATYKPGLAQKTFFEGLVNDLSRLPGVDHAGLVTCPPLGCHWGNFFKAEGAPPPAKDASDPVTLTRYASPDYFATMGIRFVHGRAFAENEGFPKTGFRPVVINEELARHLWPNIADPVGKRLASRGDTTQNWSTVVGVVSDVKHYGVATPMIPGLYFAMTRVDSTSNFDSYALVVHTAGNPTALFPSIRAVIRARDPELPIVGLKTAQASLDQSLGDARLVAFSLAAFAVVALTLAIGGIYAMLSYVVGRRRHEIGIRMALGAQQRQVRTLIVGQGLRLVAFGLILGVPLAAASSRVMSSLLAGVATTDPLTYALVVGILAITGAIAAFVPARRAASMDPKIALNDGA